MLQANSRTNTFDINTMIFNFGLVRRLCVLCLCLYVSMCSPFFSVSVSVSMALSMCSPVFSLCNQCFLHRICVAPAALLLSLIYEGDRVSVLCAPLQKQAIHMASSVPATVLPATGAAAPQSMGGAMSSSAVTIFLVGAWYSSTALFSVLGKRLLKGAGKFAYSDLDDAIAWHKLQIVTAVSLTWLQSGVAFLVYAIARASGVVEYLRPGKEGKADLTTSQMLATLRTPGILYFLGNLFGNLAMVMATVSTTQTYKAAEPLFVVVCLRFLNYETFEKQVTKAVVLWLFFIVLGVAVGTYNPPMSLTAMFVAGCSNIVFAISAVQIKTIQDDTSLPMLDIFGACVAVGTLAGAAVTAITVLASGGQIGLNGMGNASKQDGFMSGAAYGLYNCFSFLVLGAVTNTTHAVLKVGKRICTLVIAGLILHDHLGYQQWFGIWMAISAIVMFEDAKKANTSGTSLGNNTRPVPWKLLSAAASFVLLAVPLTDNIALAAGSNHD